MLIKVPNYKLNQTSLPQMVNSNNHSSCMHTTPWGTVIRLFRSAAWVRVKDAPVAPCWRICVSVAKQWAGLHNWYFHTSLCRWREDWQALRHKHRLVCEPCFLHEQRDWQTSTRTDTNSPHTIQKTNYIRSCCLVSCVVSLSIPCFGCQTFFYHLMSHYQWP